MRPARDPGARGRRRCRHELCQQEGPAEWGFRSGCRRSSILRPRGTSLVQGGGYSPGRDRGCRIWVRPAHHSGAAVGPYHVEARAYCRGVGRKPRRRPRTRGRAASSGTGRSRHGADGPGREAPCRCIYRQSSSVVAGQAGDHGASHRDRPSRQDDCPGIAGNDAGGGGPVARDGRVRPFPHPRLRSGGRDDRCVRRSACCSRTSTRCSSAGRDGRGRARGRGGSPCPRRSAGPCGRPRWRRGRRRGLRPKASAAST